MTVNKELILVLPKRKFVRVMNFFSKMIWGVRNYFPLKQGVRKFLLRKYGVRKEWIIGQKCSGRVLPRINIPPLTCYPPPTNEFISTKSTYGQKTHTLMSVITGGVAHTQQTDLRSYWTVRRMGKIRKIQKSYGYDDIVLVIFSSFQRSFQIA